MNCYVGERTADKNANDYKENTKYLLNSYRTLYRLFMFCAHLNFGFYDAYCLLPNGVTYDILWVQQYQFIYLLF